MPQFKKYKLSNLIEIIGGGTPKTSVSEYWNGDIPWLSVVDFGGDNKKVYKTDKAITVQGLKNSSTKLLKKGQLIISARGTVGEIAMLGVDMAFNQSCYGLNAVEGTTTNNFLYYLLKNELESIKSVTHGSVFDTITRQTFDQIEVEIPEDLPTQTLIASILSSLDDKIELNRRTNQTLEQIAQTLFKKYFVDDIDPENLPEGWRWGKLGELFTLQRGFDLPSTERINGKVPVYAASGFNGFHNKAMITGLGITTGRSGVIGNVFYIIEDFWPLNTSLFIKEFKISNPLHAFYVLKNIDLEGLNTGSAVPTLNRNEVHSLDVIIPSENLILKFEEKMIPIFKLINENERQNKSIEKIRDSLLPKLMSGEIEVNAIENELVKA